MVLAGVVVGFVVLVALGLSLILPAVRSADGTIRVNEISDTSAVIVITDAPKGSAYTWAQSPCRAVPADGRYQLLGLTPGKTYQVTLYSDPNCEYRRDWVSFTALLLP